MLMVRLRPEGDQRLGYRLTRLGTVSLQGILDRPRGSQDDGAKVPKADAPIAEVRAMRHRGAGDLGLGGHVVLVSFSSLRGLCAPFGPF